MILNLLFYFVNCCLHNTKTITVTITNSNTKTFNTKTINTETFNTETINTETFNTKTINTETFNTETFNTETFNTETINTETINTETINIDTNTNTNTNTIATFYFRVGEDIQGCPPVQTFNDNYSYGPCNFNGTLGVKYTSKSKYWVAIKNAESYCGKDIIVNYNNNKVKLKVMDECPSCHIDNRVDMSLEALIELTGSKEKACAINTISPKVSWYHHNI
jgi:hypothetical protein